MQASSSSVLREFASWEAEIGCKSVLSLINDPELTKRGTCGNQSRSFFRTILYFNAIASYLIRMLVKHAQVVVLLAAVCAAPADPPLRDA